MRRASSKYRPPLSMQKIHAMVASEREGKIKGEEKIFKEIAVASYSNLFKLNLCTKKKLIRLQEE